MEVPRPGNDMHSNMQITWLSGVMHTQKMVLNYALNGYRLGAGEMYVQIQKDFRDKEKLTSFTGCRSLFCFLSLLELASLNLHSLRNQSLLRA